MSETPRLWRRLYEGWLLVAAHFGEVQTQILVSLVYALGVGPLAAGGAALRKDMLAKRKLRGEGSAWLDADTVSHPDLERARRLF